MNAKKNALIALAVAGMMSMMIAGCESGGATGNGTAPAADASCTMACGDAGATDGSTDDPATEVTPDTTPDTKPAEPVSYGFLHFVVYNGGEMTNEYDAEFFFDPAVNQYYWDKPNTEVVWTCDPEGVAATGVQIRCHTAAKLADGSFKELADGVWNESAGTIGLQGMHYNPDLPAPEPFSISASRKAD